jgi:polar amino acid transport system substrate-binding protein
MTSYDGVAKLIFMPLTPCFYSLLRFLLLLGVVISSATAAPPEVRVGMGLTKPPYVFESGKEGIEVEIAEQALAVAGYKMVGLQFPPARGLAMHRAGQLDVLLTVDEGIGGTGCFSAPYIVYQNVAISLASHNFQIKSIEDLANYSVAAFQNAEVILGDRFKNVVEGHSNYKEYPQQIIQNNLLYSQRVDVVVGDRRIFRFLSTQLDSKLNVKQPIAIHTIFPPNPRKAVFLDKTVRDRFNAGLKTIQANGVYDAIMKKHANL